MSPTIDLPPSTLDDTFSGDPVLEYAAPELAVIYRSQFWTPDDDNDQIDAIFAWLHAFHDGCLSGKDTVRPLFDSIFNKMHTLWKNPLAAIIIIGVHYREPWLYRRLTFHALADVARYRSNHKWYADFCQLMEHRIATNGYVLRNVYDEIELRKKLAEAETTTISKAQAEESKARSETTKRTPRPKMVDCSLCNRPTPEKTAHIHQGLWIGDDCCWDEALRSSE